jgi:hypothetical protein
LILAGSRRAPVIAFDAVGVPQAGDDPDSSAQVRCPELASREARPFRVIPVAGQVSENSTDRSLSPALTVADEKRGNVLHDDEVGSKFANDPGELGPKTRPGSFDAGAPPGVGKVLAGESATDEVDGCELRGTDCPNLGESLGPGEVAGEDGSAEGIALDLPEHAHTAPLKAEIKSPDTGEE